MIVENVNADGDFRPGRTAFVDVMPAHLPEVRRTNPLAPDVLSY